MDFFFIPGETDAEKAARKYFPKRPGTTLIKPRPVRNHVEGFLDALGSVTPPIGDIITVAHGSDIGFYGLPLKGSVPAPADFEKVSKADKDDTIRIDPALLTPAGGGAQATITLRLMGCNVGQARPLVEKFKTAMTPKSGALNVIAPLHFDEIESAAGGLVEYLAHNFTLRVKDKFKTRNDLLNAFHGLAYLDGTKISDDTWKTVVPTDIHPPKANWQQRFKMFVNLNPPANGKTSVKVHREYRFRMVPFDFTWGAPDPGNDHDRIELLRKSLPKASKDGLKLYDPAYPWPLWKRSGFASLDNFVDNLNWKDTVTKDASNNVTHSFHAEMAEYTIMLPLTDPPAAGKDPTMKFYNFYPDAAAGSADMHIDESNGQLFLIL